MKSISLVLLTTVLSTQIIYAQNIGINATGAVPDASAMLDVQSTNKGMLIPRMSTAQRNAIATPATGLMVFDNNTNSFWFKNPTGWVQLIDSSNTVWTKKDTSVYLNHNENVGIGTSAPAVRLQVSNGTDANAASGGYLQLGGTTNQNLAFDNNEIQSRDNGFASDVFLQAGGGNVGIGTKLPEVRLQVSNGTDVSTAGGYFQLGAGSVANLAFDNNEIQARNDSKPSTLYLQNSGGNLQLGSSALAIPTANLNVQNGDINMQKGDINMLNGKLTKPATGSFNMMPLCYGKIASNGTILSASPNISVQKTGTGQYTIHCDGITSSTAMVATPNAYYGPISVEYIKPGEVIVVFLFYDGSAGNAAFSFIFYNP
jgi:hypothetical protein